MNTTRIDIYTRIKGSHRHTELTIDWDGLSEADIKHLAQRYLVATIQDGYVGEGKAPDKDKAYAHSYINNYAVDKKPLGRIANLPEHLNRPADKSERAVKDTDSTDAPNATDWYKQLTEDDRRALIKILSMG